MPKTDTPPGKKLPKKPPESVAYSIWLAGLGALAVAKEKKGNHLLFNRLLKRGRDLEILGMVDQIPESDLERLWRRSVESVLEQLGTETIEIEQLGRETIEIEHLREQLRLGKISRKAHSRPRTVGTEVGPLAPSAAEVAHLRRNAQARKAFLAEFGTLTSREVAEQAGSRAANQAALANRWKAEGRIFAVEMGGQTLFPAFQFSDDDGKPRLVIAEILAVLQPKLSGWQTALWFSGRNGWLGAKRPVDLLTSDPDAVAEAARQEAEAFD